MLWISKLPPHLLVTSSTPCLLIPLFEHLLASNEMLVPADRQYIGQIIAPLAAALTNPSRSEKLSSKRGSLDTPPLSSKIKNPDSEEWEENEAENAIADVISTHILPLTKGHIPATLRSLFYVLEDYGHRIPTMWYPSGVYSEFCNLFAATEGYSDCAAASTEQARRKPRSATVQPGIALCVETFFRFGLAPFFLKHVTNIPPKKARATASLLKQLGGAVWRIGSEEGMATVEQPATRFSQDPLTQEWIGSNDRNYFLVQNARLLYNWMKGILARPRQAPRSFVFDKTGMPKLGTDALYCLVDYIIHLDGDLHNGAFDACRQASQEPIPFSSEDLTERTRNYEPLVLAAMTLRNRRYPIRHPAER